MMVLKSRIKKVKSIKIKTVRRNNNVNDKLLQYNKECNEIINIYGTFEQINKKRNNYELFTNVNGFSHCAIRSIENLKVILKSDYCRIRLDLLLIININHFGRLNVTLLYNSIVNNTEIVFALKCILNKETFKESIY